MRVSDFNILNEGSADYKVMFQPLLDLMQEYPEYRERVERESVDSINWAKRVLKRYDRCIWFLRIARRELIEQVFTRIGARYNHEPDYSDKFLEKLDLLDARWKQGMRGSNDNHPFRYTIRTLRERLAHWMGLASCEEIQDYRFKYQAPDEVMVTFERFEEAWKKTRQGEMVDDGAVAFLKFDDGLAWYNGNKPYCTDEGDAMGHCGNQYDWEPGDTILSLRRRINKSRVRPSLTFILDEDGYLGETKGRENAKPNAKYHKHIIALLKNPIIKGIKGGGYEPQNNFELSDLTDEQRADLYAARPDLMDPLSYFEQAGNTETFRKKVAKMVNADNGERPSDGPFKPQWIFHPKKEEWVFAFNEHEDWPTAFSMHGDNSVSNAINWPGSSDFFTSIANYGVDGSFFRQLPSDLREQTFEMFKVELSQADWLHEKFCDFIGVPHETQLDSSMMDDAFDFIADNAEPKTLHDAAWEAEQVGKSEGTYNEICETLERLGNLGTMTLDAFNNGHLWATAEQIAKWCSMPREESPVFNHETPMYKPVHFPNDPMMYSGWDRDAAADRYRRELD